MQIERPLGTWGPHGGARGASTWDLHLAPPGRAPKKNLRPLSSPGESPSGALSRLEGLHPSWGRAPLWGLPRSFWGLPRSFWRAPPLLGHLRHPQPQAAGGAGGRRGQETERTKLSTNPLKNGTNKKSWEKRTSKKKEKK